VFLANYSDGLTNLQLPVQIEQFHAHGKIASCICITPPLSYHIISMGQNDHVEKIEGMTQANMKVNGGYFIFKKDIFRYIQPGEELVVEPFQRLIKERQLLGYKHDGYWECMDTFKDKQRLDEMYARGDAPWELWRSPQKV
jgi:glucose-1-phosphate cytidylyltransferase